MSKKKFFCKFCNKPFPTITDAYYHICKEKYYYLVNEKFSIIKLFKKIKKRNKKYNDKLY